jgi:predicted RNase H-like nuclease (RuvC/YqgF family)
LEKNAATIASRDKQIEKLSADLRERPGTVIGRGDERQGKPRVEVEKAAEIPNVDGRIRKLNANLERKRNAIEELRTRLAATENLVLQQSQHIELLNRSQSGESLMRPRDPQPSQTQHLGTSPQSTREIEVIELD